MCPPDLIVVDGQAYRINTDFRTGIAYSQITADKCKWQDIADICFPADIPENVDGAMKSLNAFYACGETSKDGGKASASPPYSFIADLDVIYAAFAERYHIDLHTASLHWWTFRALLGNCLGDTLQQRVEYRFADTSKMQNTERKTHYARMKQRYALDRNGKKHHEPQTLEERNAMWLNGG